MGEAVVLSEDGKVVQEEWLKTPLHRPYVQLDHFVIMPNHLHGIVMIREEELAEGGTARRAPTAFGAPQARSLAAIVGAFKSASARRINELHGTRGQPMWQRNYYEHIIRDDESLSQIRRYVGNNPLQWHLDPENPNRK